MGDFDFIKLQVAVLEVKLGVAKGGWLFWIYVFNWFASLALVVVLAGLVHWVFSIVAVIFVVAPVVLFVDVTGIWNKAHLKGRIE